MNKSYLQNIVDSISFEDLPAKWQEFDFVRFSKDKKLFNFQQDALKNAVKALHLYFKDKNADKGALFDHYKLNGLEENFDYDLKKKQDSKTVKYLLEYPDDYPVIDNKISFAHFINRMSFWMATGSGKTLIIVKLIEILGKLIAEKELPAQDILFLAHRDDLLDQFKDHVEEFNSFNFDTKINLKSLRDYESVKRENPLPSAKNEITVFYYRSDLISDEHKEKIVNFQNYDNGGKWYILLDEAHKGDKEDSKRQILYSILSRNGFLFNFSATFTDPIDFATCAFNFNLSKFVEGGYGKHIYVSQLNISAFKDKDDFSLVEKQKIVLKTLLLLTYINKHFEEIRKIDNSLYHRPLLLTKDILKYVFNANTPGKIEVLKIPANKQELIFKLSTSEKPFALIKIGDISGWLKDKLEGYEINESFENESYFRRINSDDSDINILMGSRSFYEGWDSNRPNLILFVNIGVGSDAKKFVLQSVGRGVRIEPQKYQRKRLQNLFNAGLIDGKLFNNIKDHILPLETLFVFGTNAENLKEIIKTLKEERQDINLGDMFIVNPEAKERLLLVPVYKTTERIFAEEQNPQKYSVSREDFDITSQFYEFLGDKIALVKYDCEVKVLKKAKESFKEENKSRYYTLEQNGTSLNEPKLILGRIFNYFGVKNMEFDKFKELENEIVHFKKVRFIDGDKYEEIKRKIEEIRRYPERQKELDEKYGKIPREEFERQMYLFTNAGNFEMKNQRIKIKYLANHYYLPVILSEQEKIDYINHIINVPSEVKFIEELEKYLLKESNNVFKQFDWWMFSKLDQTLDEVSIPYYNPKENKIARFKPDFIFWMKKGNRYLILFVDPKGTEYTDGYRKIDGYSRIFEIEKDGQKQSRDFTYNGLTINTKLLLKPRRGIAEVLENYKQYWFDNFEAFSILLTK